MKRDAQDRHSAAIAAGGSAALAWMSRDGGLEGGLRDMTGGALVCLGSTAGQNALMAYRKAVGLCARCDLVDMFC